MAIGLGLLAVFLFFYLVSVYKKEQADLSRATSYMLENAFKSAENQLLDRMIVQLRTNTWQFKDSAKAQVNIINHPTRNFFGDTLTAQNKYMGITQTAETFILQSNDTSRVHHNALNLRIAFQSDSFCLDTSFTDTTGDTKELVEAIFKKNLHAAKLDIRYQLIPDSNQRGSRDSMCYHDVFSGKKYFLIQDNNQAYLLRHMLPEIILSVFLFLAVWLAFHHVIESSRKRQEIFSMKEDFMRNMTHELKTPIATIGVSLEALQNFPAGKDESLRQEYFRIAENENRKLNVLVDRVLNISQTMDDSIGIPEPTDLSVLISEVVESFRMRAEHQKVQLTFEQPVNLGIIRINPQLVLMAMHNLIDNAIKYVQRESAQVKVSISETSKEMCISVWDNGQPIEPNYRDKIFEKFYRIPHGDIHNVKGHGLGLYIVSQLAHILGGRIVLRVANEGNEFTLCIPKNV